MTVPGIKRYYKFNKTEMYVQHYIVSRPCDRCCHGNIIIHSTFTVVGAHTASNNVKVFSFAMEM
jgi:hypothetical protein